MILFSELSRRVVDYSWWLLNVCSISFDAQFKQTTLRYKHCFYCKRPTLLHILWCNLRACCWFLGAFLDGRSLFISAILLIILWPLGPKRTQQWRKIYNRFSYELHDYATITATQCHCTFLVAYPNLLIFTVCWEKMPTCPKLSFDLLDDFGLLRLKSKKIHKRSIFMLCW